MKPLEKNESRRFVRTFLLIAFIWFLGGYFYSRGAVNEQLAFTQIFIFSFLDIAFLMIVFFRLFFLQDQRGAQKLLTFVFFFFKLVCLAFLAITLKRFRNASVLLQIYGVSVVWAAPLLAAVWVKYFPRSKNDRA